MKITLLSPDSTNGLFGINLKGLKLNVDFDNKNALKVFEDTSKEQIEGSIWEGKVHHNDLGEMIFNITKFVKYK